jgi:hypothetical protein
MSHTFRATFFIEHPLACSPQAEITEACPPRQVDNDEQAQRPWPQVTNHLPTASGLPGQREVTYRDRDRLSADGVALEVCPRLGGPTDPHVTSVYRLSRPGKPESAGSPSAPKTTSIPDSTSSLRLCSFLSLGEVTLSSVTNCRRGDRLFGSPVRWPAAGVSGRSRSFRLLVVNAHNSRTGYGSAHLLARR